MPSSLYLCVHVCDFAAQALARSRPELSQMAVAVLSGTPPLECVFAMNPRARFLGLEFGMSRVQSEAFPMEVLRRNRQQEDASFAEVISCARQFSPRIETIASPQEDTCGATLVLDVSGSERLLGSAWQIAATLQQSVDALGHEASVVASHNAYTAVLAAKGIPGATVIKPGQEANTLAPLPLTLLELDDVQAQTFATWGIHTLGQLAMLPAKSLAARVGQSGLRLRALARGEYRHLLVPTEEPSEAVLCEGMEVEHPVEMLEPLLFLLSHMLEQVMQRAARRALVIASVETCLILDDASRSEHRRTVRPALPERDLHTLLKLIQLDLELHPPEAAVIALRVEAHPARPQTMQHGLFAAQAPAAGRLEILLARLRKLVGEGHVGAPELFDSHAPEAFGVTSFEPGEASLPSSVNRMAQPAVPVSALRMVRPPRVIGIDLYKNAPAAMYYEGRRLSLHACSGPWRTNGAWWTLPAWCREEWDVVLKEQPQCCLRLAHDPGANCWYLIGIYD
ncbi:MAG TPA: DNA polymerase Y family protein [Candidatus Angelobacter sp.]|nr:DNA polymerase Y family protein [Candidatus Angelobacter sp.]